MLHFSVTLIKGGPTPSSSANVISKSYLGLLHCKCGSRSLCREASPFHQLTTAVTIRNYLQEVFSPLKIFYPWLSHCLSPWCVRSIVFSYTIHPTVTYAAVKGQGMNHTVISQSLTAILRNLLHILSLPLVILHNKQTNTIHLSGIFNYLQILLLLF